MSSMCQGIPSGWLEGNTCHPCAKESPLGGWREMHVSHVPRNPLWVAGGKCTSSMCQGIPSGWLEGNTCHPCAKESPLGGWREMHVIHVPRNPLWVAGGKCTSSMCQGIPSGWLEGNARHPCAKESPLGGWREIHVSHVPRNALWVAEGKCTSSMCQGIPSGWLEGNARHPCAKESPLGKVSACRQADPCSDSANLSPVIAVTSLTAATVNDTHISQTLRKGRRVTLKATMQCWKGESTSKTDKCRHALARARACV